MLPQTPVLIIHCWLRISSVEATCNACLYLCFHNDVISEHYQQFMLEAFAFSSFPAVSGFIFFLFVSNFTLEASARVSQEKNRLLLFRPRRDTNFFSSAKWFIVQLNEWNKFKNNSVRILEHICGGLSFKIHESCLHNDVVVAVFMKN